MMPHAWSIFFFFNDTATTEIYTLSLHDALPIFPASGEPKKLVHAIEPHNLDHVPGAKTIYSQRETLALRINRLDRKSTRLNSSHQIISYAVFCLKKKTCIVRASPAAARRGRLQG